MLLHSNLPQKKAVLFSSIERKTFCLDCFRFILQGFIDVEFKTYVLLIAIRVFDMSNNTKGILAAASYVGMASTPFVLRFFTKVCPLKTNYAISVLLFVVSIMIGFALFTDRWLIFLIAIVIAKICYKQTLPFVTDIYNQNYPKERRGWIIGKLFTILAISSIVFVYFCSKLLDKSLSNYRWVLLISALSAFICGCIFLKIPNGRTLSHDSESFLRSNLSILLNDRLFSVVLGLWSLMSIAFQMTFPLRTEYLANQCYGLNLSNSNITLITVIIPTIMRIVSSLFWGKIFDTQNFAIMKIMINLCFLISIPTFFFTRNFTLWILSTVALGLGYGGNLTAWQLWVTKIVPSPEKLGAYVSLDIATMGLRDALSAALGYFLLSHSVSLHTICVLAIVLIGISTVGFCFLTKNPRLD
ncbi:MAG: MFS transporter [Puniceicoccales bacterium]|jgi:predicted MFS family arabinose efflux permease|nr:MFS transporter [Puniceicoccales bacterium]